MASLTTANMLTRIANQVRIPESNTTETAKLLAIGNMIYREIASKADWYWLRKRQIINTVAPFETGTVALTKGSVAGTLSASTATNLAERVLHVPGNDVESGLYRLVATSGNGSADLTLASAYTGADTTDSAYKIWADEYDLASDTGEIRSIRRFGYTEPMRRLGYDEMQQLKAYDRSEGTPQVWAVFDFDTSGDPTTAQQLIVHPFPDDTYQLEILYKQALNTELSGSTRPLIPDDYLHVWEWGWLSVAYPVFLADPTRGQVFSAKYADALNLMVSQHRAHDQHPQVVPADAYRGFYRRRRVSGANVDLGSWFDRLPNDF